MLSFTKIMEKQIPVAPLTLPHHPQEVAGAQGSQVLISFLFIYYYSWRTDWKRVDLQVLNDLLMAGINSRFPAWIPPAIFPLIFMFWSPHKHLMPLHLVLGVLPSC